MIEIIRKFDFEKYKKDVSNFYYKYPFYGDGHASVKNCKVDFETYVYLISINYEILMKMEDINNKCL